MLRFADLITQVHSLMIDETVAELMQRMDCQWLGRIEEGGMEEDGMEEGDLVPRWLDFDFEMASSEQEMRENVSGPLTTLESLVSQSVHL